MGKNKKVTMALAGIFILAIVGLWFFFSSPDTMVNNSKNGSRVMVEAGQDGAIESGVTVNKRKGTVANGKIISNSNKAVGSSEAVGSNKTVGSSETANSNKAVGSNKAANSSETVGSNGNANNNKTSYGKKDSNSKLTTHGKVILNNKISANGKVASINKKTDTSSDLTQVGIVTGRIEIKPAIDYKDLEMDKELKTLMDTRKKNLGIKKSLDMIVKSNETFIIGGSKVSMQEILEKACTEQGEIFQEKISNSGEYKPEKIKEYGIYVVRPGDNLWNIHFSILKEYYSVKGIEVASEADEPVTRGFSSGVGKILKFSEKIVIIYNLIDKKIVKNINLLEPLSKLVIYNMDEIFTLLREINYENVNRIQFDGKNIWIPAKKS